MMQRQSFAGYSNNRLFSEPFLIRWTFADGTQKDFVVSNEELEFLKLNMGPDDSFQIIKDQGEATLESRVSRNEQNLLQLGRDTTDLGEIAVRHEDDIQQLWTKSGTAATQTQIAELWSSQEVQNEKLVELGSSGGSDFLTGLLGGFGGGAVIVLILIAIVMLKK